MRVWAYIGSVPGVRSTVGDPDQIWGRARAAVGRPGPAGAPTTDLLTYLGDEIRRWSSSTGEDDPESHDFTTSSRVDAAGAGSWEHVASPAGTVGSHQLGDDGSIRHQILTVRAVMSCPTGEPVPQPLPRFERTEPALAR
jgi:hypothetical protein